MDSKSQERRKAEGEKAKKEGAKKALAANFSRFSIFYDRPDKNRISVMGLFVDEFNDKHEVRDDTPLEVLTAAMLMECKMFIKRHNPKCRCEPLKFAEEMLEFLQEESGLSLQRKIPTEK